MHSTKERERQAVQDLLDSERTQRERNERGQFATPSGLAADIVSFAHSLLPKRATVRFLDPAFGTGAFYSALLKIFSKDDLAAARGIEIDPHHARHAMELWRDTPLDLGIADFTRETPPSSEDKKATLIICNPPYVRHHHLTSQEKAHLREQARQQAGISLSGLSGLYCYFLAIAHAWMAEDSLAGWLIPSEFMDVNYGQALKEYLLKRVTLLRIHRYDPHDTQFEDALVSSAVVWFKNAPPPSDHRVSFTVGGTLQAPAWSQLISTDSLSRAPKWTPFFLAEQNGRSEDQIPRLSDFFDIKRGLATGANKFFVLDAEQIEHFRLPSQFLVPILPSPRFLTSDIIEADDKGQPLFSRQRFLLTCNLPEKIIEARYPDLWRYLQGGVESGFSARYLCTHRTPWYAQEVRPPAPFLCTYMGRSENGQRKPFRFILNRSLATAPNVYLILYPKPSLSELLKGRPTLLEPVWKALNHIPAETLIGEGRVYGGGLFKLEPKELGNALAEELVAALDGTRAIRHHQQLLFQ